VSCDSFETSNKNDTSRVIIAFTKDWSDVPTCTTHILGKMAKTHPVLWVESIGTRKPSVRSSKDWVRILKRLTGILAPPVQQCDHLYVLRPLLIPKATGRVSRWLNQMVFRWYVWQFLQTKIKQPNPVLEYWCFVPNAVDLLPSKSATNRFVYYVADDWTAFHNLDGAWMRSKENCLLQKADCVFATSRFLVDKLNKERRQLPQLDAVRDVVYMPHGTDYELFSSALDQEKELPPSIVDIPRPIVGFYGNLHPWIDFALIQQLAEKRPNWSFVLIGEDYGVPQALHDLPNVFLLGRREHAQLPDYCRAFDVAMIPYDMRQVRMASVNPVKTKELLSAGVPVVAAHIPEIAGMEGVMVCQNPSDWIPNIETQMQRSIGERKKLSESMRNEDWSQKVQEIRRIVETR
jgi:glycosyltransferase involved in cell wall biosynthesis